MLEPIHTHKTSYYLIERPCLFFAVSEKVTTDKFREYFTNKSIQSLLKYEFIKLVIP